MTAFDAATRRLASRWTPGTWVGAVRLALDAEGAAGRVLPPHYLVALWEPPDAARPVLPRWPAVAAIASPDAQAALLELMSHVPGQARVWLADEAVDWALVADIVRRTDRHLTLAHHEGLEHFIDAVREAEAARIAREYSDRDPGFERFRQRLVDPGGDGGQS